MKVTPCLYSFSTSRVTISLYNSSLDTMLQPIDTFPFGLLFALHQYSALEENVRRCSAYCTSVACGMLDVLHLAYMEHSRSTILWLCVCESFGFWRAPPSPSTSPPISSSVMIRRLPSYQACSISCSWCCCVGVIQSQGSDGGSHLQDAFFSSKMFHSVLFPG